MAQPNQLINQIREFKDQPDLLKMLMDYAQHGDEFHSLRPLFTALLSDDPMLQLEACEVFRELFGIIRSSNNGNLRVGEGFIELLKSGKNPAILHDIACALIAMTPTTPMDLVVLRSGALGTLLQLSTFSGYEVKLGVIQGLADICASRGSRYIVNSEGLSNPLLTEPKQPDNMDLLKHITRILYVFCKPSQNHEHVRLILQTIAKLIHLDDIHALTDLCKMLECLPRRQDTMEALMDVGILPKLIGHLQHNSKNVVSVSKWTICGILKLLDDMDPQIIMHLVDHNVLPCLSLILRTGISLYKMPISKMVFEITGGGIEHKQAVIDANIIPILMDFLHTDYSVLGYVLSAICNITRGSEVQRKYLVDQGFIKPVCDFIAYPDNNISELCLEGLHNIMLRGGDIASRNLYALHIYEVGGVEMVESLQRSNYGHIAQRAKTIVETFYQAYDSQKLNSGGYGLIDHNCYNFCEDKCPLVSEDSETYC